MFQILLAGWVFPLLFLWRYRETLGRSCGSIHLKAVTSPLFINAFSKPKSIPVYDDS